MAFNGLGLNLGNLSRLSAAESRSICPENPTGGKGAGAMLVPDEKSFARALGRGWKASPNWTIEPGQTRVLADINGSGAIQQIWITPTGPWRNLILRITWDDAPSPAVECPLGDFFACGWNRYSQVSSLPVCINPGSALNCYWEMPFRSRALLTLTNIGEAPALIYYQVNYALTEVESDAAYFHAQFRRVNPVPYKVPYTILEGVRGRGHYVGTYLAWGVHSPGWWGEGEIKFFIDGDSEFPTICGTGTEDYFGGSYNFDLGRDQGGYREFTTPYTGLQVIRPDGLYQSQTRFGMYRWHVMDPVRFKSDLRVTIQDLGIGGDIRRGTALYEAREDDIGSVAFWYQTLPTAPFPPLPSRRELQI